MIAASLARALVRVLGALAFTIVASWSATAVAGEAEDIIFGKSDPDICWKDTHGRGVGKVPDACPRGHERTGADLLCYPICRSGYTGVGPVCWQNCPSGFRNDGAFCAKPAAYGRGAGYPWTFGDTAFSLDDARRRCARDNPQGCEKSGEIIYPKCKPGYKPVGCCICSPECPSNMAGDIGVSCTKKSYGRGVGQGAFCGAGQEQDFQGGLCYPKCNAGADGVGPVCWGRCPANFPVNCGAACGVSEAACAFAIIDQVQSSSDVVLNVAALVATAGTASAGLRAAQTAGRMARRNLTKQARRQLKQQAEQQLANAMKWQRKRGRVQQAGEYLGKAENVSGTAELLVDAYENGEFDFTTLVPSVADVEPTGMLALVNSFNKPICGTPASTAPARRVAAASAPAPATPTPVRSSVRVQNRWKQGQFLHIERGPLVSGTVQPGWQSARWTIEPVSGTSFVRLRNAWKPNLYVHVQRGPVEVSSIQSGWWSAQWTLERVDGTQFVRIRNRWKPDVYLHIERGRLEAGRIQPGWWSAQWAVAR